MKIPAEVFRLARSKARMLLASADAAGVPHLTIRVDRVLEFRHAPHTDRPVVPAAHA